MLVKPQLDAMTAMIAKTLHKPVKIMSSRHSTSHYALVDVAAELFLALVAMFFVYLQIKAVVLR
ncbi:hypothetical protein [Candidatus Bealeia paramacronuclearis]|uniref:hypothetical protein n=1 Tax=Candidatus Bealeia paramacronuclearis TaxID=1921001 RepID=UPI002F26953E